MTKYEIRYLSNGVSYTGHISGNFGSVEAKSKFISSMYGNGYQKEIIIIDIKEVRNENTI